jgi:hypothetical protein
LEGCGGERAPAIEASGDGGQGREGAVDGRMVVRLGGGGAARAVGGRRAVGKAE